MQRHWSTRVLSTTLALWFGLVMVGPQVHQCPLHDVPTAPTAAHNSGHTSHDAPASHEHCSCPQACCPTGMGVALPAASVRLAVEVAPIVSAVPTLHRVVLPSAPRYLLPFALAPPHALA